MLVLPNTKNIEIDFKYEMSEDINKQLDIFTSQIISYGGCVTATSRHVLDQISPFLFERMAGRAGF